MKKSKLLLVSWILSALYFIYLVVYFTGAIGGSTGSEQIGASLAGMLVMPHALLVLLGLIFNIEKKIVENNINRSIIPILLNIINILFNILFFILSHPLILYQ